MKNKRVYGKQWLAHTRLALDGATLSGHVEAQRPYHWHMVGVARLFAEKAWTPAASFAFGLAIGNVGLFKMAAMAPDCAVGSAGGVFLASDGFYTILGAVWGAWYLKP
jgi:hypothetical protein